ncbi:MAG: Asp-tRNA(Asn)/Glu-tRNA(Gln) amidotransferase subunit GatC [Bacteroidota bacterium]
MTIDQTLLDKLAHLARLELSAAVEATMCQDLSKIATWIEKLSQVDTQEVTSAANLPVTQPIMREDTPQTPLPHASGLSNAPRTDSHYFRVPKVQDR